MMAKEESYILEKERTHLMLSKLRRGMDEFRRGLKLRDSSGGEPGVERLFEDAVVLYNKGDFERSSDKLKDIIRAYPQFSGAYQYLALCYWNTGRVADARKMAGRALELEPQNEELKNWIETINSDNGNKQTGGK